MNSFDVIVVGAGPAGSTCAERLKAAGLSVQLLRQESFSAGQTVCRLDHSPSNRSAAD